MKVRQQYTIQPVKMRAQAIPWHARSTYEDSCSSPLTALFQKEHAYKDACSLQPAISAIALLQFLFGQLVIV